MVLPLLLQVFDLPKYQITDMIIFYKRMAQHKKSPQITKVITIHPEWDMSVTVFMANHPVVVIFHLTQ